MKPTFMVEIGSNELVLDSKAFRSHVEGVKYVLTVLVGENMPRTSFIYWLYKISGREKLEFIKIADIPIEVL